MSRVSCTVCNCQLGESVRNFVVCNCGVLCYDCFLIQYVIYNPPPVAVIQCCATCGDRVNRINRIFVFKFTLDYFSTEFYFSNGYLV
jgi:hypothetical protein